LHQERTPKSNRAWKTAQPQREHLKAKRKSQRKQLQQEGKMKVKKLKVHRLSG
jgi:membrane protein insertase Oxa1/YidC/SpoIIIJ